MGVLLGFLPFVAFSLLQGRIGSVAALALGAAIAAALVVGTWITPPHRVNLLEAGVAVVFAALALWDWSLGAGMTLVMVHLCAKVGMLAVVLIGMCMRRPFTLTYAREQVDPAYWDSPKLLRASQFISAAWAAAFASMAAGDLVLLSHPELPQVLTFAISLSGLLAAGAFTLWFASRAKAA